MIGSDRAEISKELFIYLQVSVYERWITYSLVITLYRHRCNEMLEIAPIILKNWETNMSNHGSHQMWEADFWASKASVEPSVSVQCDNTFVDQLRGCHS